MSLKNCVIVLWVYIMYVLGIWIFSSGYLLKRIVIHRNSTNTLNLGSHIICQNISSFSTIGEHFRNNLNNKNSSKFSSSPLIKSPLKLHDRAVIIIIDALRYDFTIYRNNSRAANNSYYLNKLPVFDEVIRTYPKQSFHLKLFADPPTTTLQRLKGITTGSLPTFIDIGLNFASTQIQEDNIISQLNRFNRNIVFMGDETWESIYPNQFLRSYPFPSFNVKDLDTVDNGILNHIYLEMKKLDWSVLIAHFVGVDHCGHRYGPSHPAMSTKLRQMNEFIRNLTEEIKNDTIMIVMGDHGMTSSGDHGGDSLDEIATSLFIYSPGKHIEKIPAGISAFQVDLVPTMALLLGIPIPFSNLGSVILNPFTSLSSNYCFTKEIDPLLARVLALAENAYQVHTYLTEYTKHGSELPKSVFTKAETYLKNASFLWDHLNETNMKQHLHILQGSYRKYLLFVREECRKTWATFNLNAMVLGLLVVVCAIGLNLIYSEDIKLNYDILKSVSILVVISTVMYFLYFQKTYVFVLLSFGILFTCRKFLEACVWDIFVILKNRITFSMLIIILLFCNSMSNSYVVYEDAVILFLVESAIVYQFFLTILQALATACDKTKRNKTIGRKMAIINYIPVLLFLCLLICVRVGSVFNKCREEQFGCESSIFLSLLANLPSASSSFKVFRLCLSWMSIMIPIAAAMLSARWTMKEKNYTAGMICVNYGLVFVGICACLHWWLSIVPAQILDRILAGNQIMPARCALALSIVIFMITWIFPLLPEKPWEAETNHLFSGSLCLFTLSILLPLYLIAGDGLAPSVTLLCMTSILYLTLNKFQTYDLESQMWMQVITWGLFSNHWFYHTGHQAVFPAIQWEAAFVFQKDVSSYIFAGFCVVCNTFLSHTIYGITLPLLLTWNQPPKDPDKFLFKLVLKYICYHAIKLLSAMVACFILRRHLMVWKIFTPKFIYEIIGMIITMASSLLSYLFALRVTACYHKQIKNNFGELWFQKNE